MTYIHYKQFVKISACILFQIITFLTGAAQITVNGTQTKRSLNARIDEDADPSEMIHLDIIPCSCWMVIFPEASLLIILAQMERSR